MYKTGSKMSRVGAVATVVSVAVATAMAAAPPANAGSYEVWTCRAPDGGPAATRDEASGWRSGTIGTNPAGGNALHDGCAGGQALTLRMAESTQQPTPSWLFLHFVAPPNTTIEEYELDFDGFARAATPDARVFGNIELLTSQQRDPDYDERFYGAGPVSRRQVRHAGRSSSYVVAQVSCVDQLSAGTPCGPEGNRVPVELNVYRGTFTLEDRDAPAISSVSGDATTDRLWAGTTGISVGATDQGGGVYRLGVEVDGQIRSWVSLADAPCRAWPGTERTFLSPKPCPSTVGGAQTISTAELPEGTHTVRVLVEDAAGNQTTAYGPTTKTLERSSSAGKAGGGEGGGSAAGSSTDPGPLNGTPAVSDARLRAQWEGREGSTRSIKFNQRPVLKGQLTTPTGQPVKGAFVRVTIKRDARNSPAFDRDSLKTDGNGRFRWKLPTGVSSRSITLAYHQRVRDTKPIATRKLTLKVAAGVRLTLSRKTVRRGQTVRLKGTVVGRPLPGVGKLVELQARNRGGRWITFRTVRSRKSGAFAATYRFRNAGPARFQMRARARKSGDYPYGTGSSPARSIRVR